jgi:hypothetical protein
MGLWTVLALSGFAWVATLHPGYWQTTQGVVPIFNATHPMAIAARATTPDLWRGLGSAAFLFTQPLLLAGVDAGTALRLTFALTLVMAATGCYFWLAATLNERAAGAGAIIYLMLPMTLAAVYQEGSLAAAWTLALLPWCAAGLSQFLRYRTWPAGAFAVLGLLWLWRISPGLALVTSVWLLAYGAAVERDGWAVVIVLVTAAAGWLSLFPFWGVLAPVDEGAIRFVDLTGWMGLAWDRVYADALPALSPSLWGALPAALAFWGGWLAWREPLPPLTGRLYRFSLWSVGLSVLLTLPWTGPLWAATGGLRIVREPAELAIFAAPGIAALAALGVHLLPALQRPPLWIALLALVVIGTYPALSPVYISQPVPAEPAAVLGDNDIVILDAALVENADRSQAELTVTWQDLAPPATDYNIFFQALATGPGNEQVVAQLDSQPVPDGRPASSWRPGELFTYTYQLDLGDAPAAEPLIYYFGYYDWRDGTRLAVDGGPAAGGDDKVVRHGR